MKRSILLLVPFTLVFCSNATGPDVLAEIPIPNTSKAFTFDIGAVDQGRYYLADRTNKSLDVVDVASNTLIAQIQGGFAGQTADNDKSGPDGVNPVPGTNIVYVGDVNSVKIVDVAAKSVIKNIPLATSGTRADEGCYDADDGIMMFSHPADTMASFISTATQSLIVQYEFPDSQGLEACIYDPGTKSFYVNNDGTTANPNGEVNVIPAASVLAKNPTVAKVYPLGNCGPTGIDLGPGTDMVIGCDPAGAAGGLPAGTPLITIILDRTTGKILATPNVGGTDQVAYDSVSNRYFIAARRWQSGGVLVPPPAAVPPAPAPALATNPVLGIIDAGTRTLITMLNAGSNAHSVAIDGKAHKVFVPHAPAASNTLAPAAGITVYSTQ